jgi:excisionase family DNA binding protein
VDQDLIPSAPAPSPWLTVEQAAARAQVGKRTIYNEVAAARLRAARIGGRRELRFRAAWVDEWLEQSVTPQEVKR